MLFGTLGSQSDVKNQHKWYRLSSIDALFKNKVNTALFISFALKKQSRLYYGHLSQILLYMCQGQEVTDKAHPLLPELQILSLTISTVLEVLKHCLCIIIYKRLLSHPIHKQQLLISNLLGIRPTGTQMLTPIWKKEGLPHSKWFESVTAHPLQQMSCPGGQPHYQCSSPSTLVIDSHQTPAVTHLHFLVIICTCSPGI